MKKNVFRVIACVMVVIMALSAAPFGAFSELDLFSSKASAAWNGDYKYTVTDGKVTITSSALSISGDIVIPDTIEGYPVTIIGSEAFYNCKNITSVTIPDSVTAIQYSAFYNCKSLTSVVIPNSVTTIGNSAFYNCTGLSSVIISDSVTTIGYSAFCGCIGLIDITIGKGVSEINSCAFVDCTSLREVTIPANVTSIGSSAFGYYYYDDWCSYYKVDDFTINSCTDSVAEKYAKDNGFTFVSSGDLSLWNYEETDETVTVTGYYGTASTIEIPSELNGKPVTTIGEEAFRSNTYIKYVTIPEPVTSIGDYAFGGCGNLRSVNLPEGLTVLGQYAFSSCSRLTSILIPQSLTFLDYGVFYYCKRLKDVTLPETLTGIGKDAFYRCSALEYIKIPASLSYIGNDAFKNSALKMIEIPNPATDIYGKGTIPPRTEIRAYTGSFAHDYSRRMDRKFVSIADVESISVETMPLKTEYKVGNALDKEGLSVRVNYADGYSILKIYGFTLENTIFEEVGTQTVTVKCSDKTATFDVNAVDGIMYKIHSDETINIEISPKEITYVKFVPETAGKYTFTSLADADTYGYLYDANKNQIASDDDSGSSTNFSITRDFVAGNTYYFGARFLSSERSGAFDVKLTLDEIFCEHQNTLVVEYRDATCTINGFRNGTVCTDCGKVLEAEEILPATGHTASDWIIDREPTCSLSGERHKECTVCHETIETNYIPGKEHNYVKEVVAPTCESDGYTKYTCSLCGDVYRDDYTDLTGHHETDWIIDREPTCSSEGKMHKECTLCHETIETDYIPKTEHTETGWIVDKDSSCILGGTKHTECTVCHEIIRIEDINAKGHSWKEITTEPTCSVIGYVTRSCVDCGVTYVKEIIPAKGHKAITVKGKEATCTQTGLTDGSKCSECGETLVWQQIIPTLPHKAVIVKGKSATCTESGLTYGIKCSDCGEVLQQQTVLDATGHNEVTVKGSPATCTQDGLTDAVNCSVCGKIIKAHETIKATGHRYGSWKTTKQPTYTAEGTKTRTCTLCGETQREEVAKKKTTSISKCTVTPLKAAAYTGKAIKPALTIKNGKTILKSGTHYTVSYKNNTKIGKATVTIKGVVKNGYSGTKTLTFNIVPVSVKTLKATAAAKTVKLSWSKVTGADGYEVYMATSKSGKYKKVATVKGGTRVSYTKTGLTKGKTYYFKVRAYKAVSGKNVYGAYSAVKTIKSN